MSHFLEEIKRRPQLVEKPWTDIHTHLNFLEKTPEETLKLCREANVQRLITIGTEPNDLQTVLDLAKTYYPQVTCTLGIHPHEAEKFTPEIEAFIRSRASDKEVVAIGEIGLDYFYKHSAPDVQRDVFRRQLMLAQDFDLPVEIHTRDAEEDTKNILKEFKGQITGVLHCFTGTLDLAMAALDLGFNISISGIVTFKKAEELRNVVRVIPLDRLHVETDAPYLAPTPFRGEKNSPHLVPFTAAVVAELKGVSLSELSRQTNLNAERIFKKLPPL
ncbi:MAG: TatD family hydrolase [Bdellovibrionaceae bacterium]|nr:TatD family hydrolase [Pseudobdellovibrionaceae bacterium]